MWTEGRFVEGSAGVGEGRTCSVTGEEKGGEKRPDEGTAKIAEEVLVRALPKRGGRDIRCEELGEGADEEGREGR